MGRVSGPSPIEAPDEGSVNVAQFKAPGPVAQAYMDAFNPVTGIMGPQGSGKTIASYMKHLQWARAQPPSPVDGCRRYRLIACRSNYPDLGRTTIPSWNALFPREVGKFTSGGQNGMSKHNLRFSTGRIARHANTFLYFEVWFVAVSADNLASFAAGIEPSGFHLNEATDFPADVISKLIGRLGRYPARQHFTDARPPNGMAWGGITMDYNPPSVRHWLYALEKGAAGGAESLEAKLIRSGYDPADFAEYLDETPFMLFRQPGGLSPNAENLQNLRGGRGYYVVQLLNMTDYDARRLVHAEYGPIMDGKPVYEQFSEAKHVAPVELDAAPEIPITLGLDAGLMPAGVVRQVMPDGQKRTLKEFVPGSMGPNEFGEKLQEWLGANFPQHYAKSQAKRGAISAFGAGMIRVLADPSTTAGRNNKHEADSAWIDTVSRIIGLQARPAPTNDPTVRQEAVRQPMRKAIDAGTEGYQINPSCENLIAAYLGEYCYRERVGRPGEFTRDIDKTNPATHPADADQYAALDSGGYEAALHKPLNPANTLKPFTAAIGGTTGR